MNRSGEETNDHRHLRGRGVFLSLFKAPFTQDAENLATRTCKLWNTLWLMGAFTQVASSLKGFARKSTHASCVNGALVTNFYHKYRGKKQDMKL